MEEKLRFAVSRQVLREKSVRWNKVALERLEQKEKELPTSFKETKLVVECGWFTLLKEIYFPSFRHEAREALKKLAEEEERKAVEELAQAEEKEGAHGVEPKTRERK